VTLSAFCRPAPQRAGERVVAVPGRGGLSLIFGVTRIVNFAHGSLYMLGAYIAYTLVEAFGRRGRSASGAHAARGAGGRARSAR
jgi:hypothetical protein